MRRIVLTYILLSIIGILGARAQRVLNPMDPNNNRDQFGNQVDPNTLPDNLEDSTNTEIQSLPPKLYMWHLSETLGNRTIMPADTASLNFQNTNLVEGMFGHYNYLGNLGSPRLSRIFFERRNDEPTIFMEPFSSFFVRPDEVKFTNSNVPYTNLTYYKAGSKVNGEERFKSYFSVNANKRLAFGFNIDYLYGRGYYANQATSHFNAGLFASYIGEKYQMQAVYNNFFMKMNENGGIADDQYITHPENMSEGKKQYESSNIPVRLEQTSNRNKDFYVYLTQRYRLGFNREVTQIEKKQTKGKRAANDSTSLAAQDTIVTEEFVPVTSFIHTIKVERSRHNFRSNNEPENYYPDYYIYKDHSNDSTTAFSVKNVFGIALLEGFNKYAKAGVTAYLSHKFSRYDLMNTDTLSDMRRIRYTEQEVFIGGELAKRQGRLLHYNVNGEVGLLDKAIGQFKVNANLDLNFRLWKDTVNFYARGYVSNTLPSFYMRHYHSNHYTWDNDNMDKEFRTRVEGELNIARWGTNLRAGMENIKNYTYFNQSAMPEQNGGNIQVLSATLAQNFRLGVFHLDNEVTWQKTSNATVLPLPQLSLYHNFYILAKLAKKVLTVQLGADIRYFTKYNAPAYAPATQQFHLQATNDQIEIGGYPIVNVYANLHLKRTRIFAMMYHVNAGMGSPNYFLVPHYPINPRLFKIGVSWNFYD
ncbi:putative porin [Bacteroides fluxus]|uniref:putative porin n=1 Tax=Bacteroides fluxus TaxID=626930 RepID=UPI002A7FE2C2|nr:putative porin [Bacteroides fluxus]MDY3790780.1 putative porin [Bacteroides fluxus]